MDTNKFIENNRYNHDEEMPSKQREGREYEIEIQLEALEFLAIGLRDLDEKLSEFGKYFMERRNLNIDKANPSILKIYENLVRCALETMEDLKNELS